MNQGVISSRSSFGLRACFYSVFRLAVLFFVSLAPTFSEAGGVCSGIYRALVGKRVPLRETLFVPHERIAQDMTGERGETGPNRWRDAHHVLRSIALAKGFPVIQSTSIQGIKLAEGNLARLEAAALKLKTESTVVKVRLQHLPNVLSKDVGLLASEIYSEEGLAASQVEFSSLAEINERIELMKEKKKLFESILQANQIHQATRLAFLSDLRRRYELVEERAEVTARVRGLPLTELIKSPQDLEAQMLSINTTQAYIEIQLRELFDSEGKLLDPDVYSPPQEIADLVAKAMKDSEPIRKFLTELAIRGEWPLWLMHSSLNLRAWDRVLESPLMAVIRKGYVVVLAIPLAIFALRTNLGSDSPPAGVVPGSGTPPAAQSELSSEDQQRLFHILQSVGPPFSPYLPTHANPSEAAETTGPNPAPVGTSPDERPRRADEPRPIGRGTAR